MVDEDRHGERRRREQNRVILQVELGSQLHPVVRCQVTQRPGETGGEVAVEFVQSHGTPRYRCQGLPGVWWAPSDQLGKVRRVEARE